MGVRGAVSVENDWWTQRRDIAALLFTGGFHAVRRAVGRTNQVPKGGVRSNTLMVASVRGCCCLPFLRARLHRYVGQAAKKTKEIMDKAVGRVLFVDEAYGLNPRHGGVGSFMQEVCTRPHDCLSFYPFRRADATQSSSSTNQSRYKLNAEAIIVRCNAFFRWRAYAVVETHLGVSADNPTIT